MQGQAGVYRIFGSQIEQSHDSERDSHKGFIQVLQQAEPPLTDRNHYEHAHQRRTHHKRMGSRGSTNSSRSKTSKKSGG